MADTAIFDVDGTFVETNYQHALASKPEPDIVETALRRVEGASGVMIGDSTWDCIAAGKLDIPTVAVRTGGFSVEELNDVGAVAVFDSLRELHDALDDTSRPSRPLNPARRRRRQPGATGSRTRAPGLPDR